MGMAFSKVESTFVKAYRWGWAVPVLANGRHFHVAEALGAWHGVWRHEARENRFPAVCPSISSLKQAAFPIMKSYLWASCMQFNNSRTRYLFGVG